MRFATRWAESAGRCALLALLLLAPLPIGGPARAAGETPGSAGEAGPAADGDAEIPSRPIGRRLDRAVDFAPGGVRLDYTQRRRDWTFSYRYQRVRDRGLADGTHRLGAAKRAASGYAILPRERDTDIHTFGVMYAPRDRLTFSLTLPYLEKSALQETPGGGRRRVRSAGIGDAQLIFLVPFMRKGEERTHVHLGLNFPTGSVREQDGRGERLPYAMQLGSGSWDALWGLTYTGRYAALSWGGQFQGLYRLANNDLGYRLGTLYEGSAWCAAGLAHWLSASVRLGWTRTGNVHGSDPALDKSQNPENDNKRQGGTRLELGPGLNLLLPIFGGQRLAIEADWAIYQDLDGPQLQRDVTLSAGWQWVF